MSQSVDLDSKYVDLIAEILRQELTLPTKIYFFGARTQNKSKSFSDIDILIEADKPLSLRQLSVLNKLFDESLLPYKVDIVDGKAISQEFRAAIKNQLIPLDLS